MFGREWAEGAVSRGARGAIEMVQLTLNGEVTQVDLKTSVEEALAFWGYDENGSFAVAVNRYFVPRSQYVKTFLEEGDVIDVVDLGVFAGNWLR